jgi:carboxylesterase type B
LDATKEGPAFCQFDELTLKHIGELDSMFINVYTKDVDPKKPFPVMVYIHGGFIQIISFWLQILL